MNVRSAVLLLSSGLLPAVVACSSNESNNEDIDVSALSSEELALSSLKILGAPGVPGVVGNGACGACHSINQVNLKAWKTQFDAYMGDNGSLRNTSVSALNRINSMRRDPSNALSKFAPGKVGFLAAGAHLGLSANVSPTRHPNSYAQGKFLASLFVNAPDGTYEKWREDMLMPIEATYPRMSPTQYETVFTWLKQGMPLADRYIPETGRETTCTNNIAPLYQHAVALKSDNWATRNKDAQMAMFGCSSVSAAATTCFQQQSGQQDIFPLARSTDYGKGWEQEGSSVRVLRKLGYSTYYWMRTSADGRFVANGGGPNGRAVIADLAPALTGGTRDINAEANYDPDFFPDNKGFLFQGTTVSGAICAQSLLSDPATTNITFKESVCKPTGDAVGLYQTIGQQIADNEISDRFILNSKFASDEHHSGATTDLTVPAGPSDGIRIHVMKAIGNDVASGYKLSQTQEIKTPYQGDAMMSRSGKLVSMRVGGENGKPLGYALNALSWTNDSSGAYTFSMQQGGRICMPGNKANLSFDERFLTSHHYLTRTDFADDASYQPYKTAGAADIYVADFVTGRVIRAVHMNPGQFAVFPHFRSDGWLYFLVRDSNTRAEYIAASDIAIRLAASSPTPSP